MSRAAEKSGKKRTQAPNVIQRDRPVGRFIEQDHIILRRGGKAVGVVISMEELKYFQELEDRFDVKAAEKALADPKRTPYEAVRRRLGL